MWIFLFVECEAPVVYANKVERFNLKYQDEQRKNNASEKLLHKLIFIGQIVVVPSPGEYGWPAKASNFYDADWRGF